MSRLAISFCRRQQRRRYKLRLNNAGNRLRLSVFKSNKFIYAQAIDDANHITIASVSSNSKDFPKDSLKTYGMESFKWIGKQIADKLKAKNKTKIVFDIGGWKMHGCIKALADTARENGLEF
ncbi:50S ribosomal protein L18 [Candidatus Cytomitobacter primus]|uniref:Large ribosomal subunit protein uL18 n=1 Tax=Candidatus Cytomitobacter primus TaxID=2066024 RepID=A0A5C0UF50_9PROT|nr:50S ribosomal protein L18 [Candidatus Cytomitobacter primus]QEK38725.1 50S ribosomal protein L18 [Candidatus Cytomitobacter primus]